MMIMMTTVLTLMLMEMTVMITETIMMVMAMTMMMMMMMMMVMAMTTVMMVITIIIVIMVVPLTMLIRLFVGWFLNVTATPRQKLQTKLSVSPSHSILTPGRPSTDPITPGAWQGSHWSANF